MPADPGTRDGQIVELLDHMQTTVDRLAGVLGDMVVQANQWEATGHAALYEDVQGHVSAAAKDLDRAHSIMLNSDACDYTRH